VNRSGAIAAEFLGDHPNRIFVLAHRPASFDGRCVLVCPPFAEEMNKARRMVTELAHRLTASGVAVVVPDLFGTGDSEGDFADASWSRWIEDLRATELWINGHGWRVELLLGIRLGCLLSAHYAQQRAAGPLRALFWQPMTDGSRALEQFLRIRVAASLMRDEKETVALLKQRLSGGAVVEVGGYGLSAALAEELARLRLVQLGSALTAVHWFEVLRSADASVPGPAVTAVEELRKHGVQVTLQTVVGEPFWASTEIVSVPELLSASVAAVMHD
jgi:exosortase A-associated hydrolase 2